MVVAAAAAGILSLCAGGTAFADSHADGATKGSPGVVAGNNIHVPVHLPANVCGNSTDVAAALDAAFGNLCADTSAAPAATPIHKVPAPAKQQKDDDAGYGKDDSDKGDSDEGPGYGDDHTTPPPYGGDDDHTTPPPYGGDDDHTSPPPYGGGHSTPPPYGGDDHSTPPPYGGGHTTPPPYGGDDDDHTTPPPYGGDDDHTTPPPYGGDDDHTTPPPYGGDDDHTTPPPYGGDDDDHSTPPPHHNGDHSGGDHQGGGNGWGHDRPQLPNTGGERQALLAASGVSAVLIAGGVILYRRGRSATRR
ncbi:chaplin family protein [Streptomyces antibioticus]